MPLTMRLTLPELVRLGSLLELHMGMSRYQSPNGARADMITAQKLAYLLATLRQTKEMAIVIDLPVKGAAVDEPSAPEYYEADSVPDEPLTPAEGERLLARIRGAEPEDWAFEVEAKP